MGGGWEWVEVSVEEQAFEGCSSAVLVVGVTLGGLESSARMERMGLGFQWRYAVGQGSNASFQPTGLDVHSRA